MSAVTGWRGGEPATDFHQINSQNLTTKAKDILALDPVYPYPFTSTRRLYQVSVVSRRLHILPTSEDAANALAALDDQLRRSFSGIRVRTHETLCGLR